MLEDDAVTNLEGLHIVTHFDNFADNFMPWVGAAGVPLARHGCGSNTEICIDKNQAQITAANPCQRVAHAYPIGCRQWLTWKVLYLQRGKRGEVSAAPETSQYFCRYDMCRVKFQCRGPHGVLHGRVQAGLIPPLQGALHFILRFVSPKCIMHVQAGQYW